MNTLTARALTVGVLIALWAWVASVARLHVSLWAGAIALGCFFAAGGGGPGLPKTIVATPSGGPWGPGAAATRAAIFGGTGRAAALIRWAVPPVRPQFTPSL